jgi:hypothetical protein
MVDDAANRQRQLQPALNSITIPAAILQPPFFNVKAEDAVNYGLLGITFGHEISHAFDDSGSQYDAKGRLRNWWTAEDRRAFKERAAGLVKQYGAYSPVPGYYINGELTLGENIGDNSGLSITYKAYQRSLGGKPSPVLDGLTGEQRLYIGFARNGAPSCAGSGHRADQERSALAGRVPRQGHGDEPAGLLRGVWHQAGRQDVSGAGAARHHVVNLKTG